MKNIALLVSILLCLGIGTLAAQDKQPFEGTLVQKITSYIHVGNTPATTQIFYQKMKGKYLYSIIQGANKEVNRSIYDFSDPGMAVAYSLVKTASGKYAAWRLRFPYDPADLEPLRGIDVAPGLDTIDRFGYRWVKKVFRNENRMLEGYVLTDFYQAMGDFVVPICVTQNSEIKLNGAPYVNAATELLSFTAEPVADSFFELPEGTAIFDTVEEWSRYINNENKRVRRQNPEAYRIYEREQAEFNRKVFEQDASAHEMAIPDAVWDF